MRILGIDPGIGRVGWGIIEGHSANSKWQIADAGCFETTPNSPVVERLVKIYEWLSKLLAEYQPDCLAIEELFFNTNAKTAFLVGQARGVILLTAGQQQIPVTIYTPLQVKIALTGYGRAEKSQVAQMVKSILHLKQVPALDDTTDALAIALTYSFSSKRLTTG